MKSDTTYWIAVISFGAILYSLHDKTKETPKLSKNVGLVLSLSGVAGIAFAFYQYSKK